LDQSVVTGRSKCTKCKKQINWYDNIPFFSFILLKGKCRCGKSVISFQYFLVEAIAAISFLFVFFVFGLTTTTLLFFILIISFIIIFFIDLKHFIIPNQITYGLMVIGFIKSFDPNLNRSIFPDYIHSLVGGVFGYSIIWLLIFFYKKFKNKDGMGLGDAKLLSALGFWFGWISIPFILIFSSLTALGFSLPSLIRKSKNLSTEIPFGPHLVIGCIIYILSIDLIFKFLV
tara:strand:- start:278 stop:967 length:690 start_codon:yes stop_codon:yes gene_type:complete